MKEQKYSAGAVSKGFWFQELRKYIELLQSGKTEKEIRELQANENVLLAPSLSYGQKMIGEVSKRAKAIPKEIIKIFFNLNVSDQKLINLLGIMMTDRLFFEFMYEVYREDNILGAEEFEEKNLRVFFKNKSEQSEKVAGFTEQTIKRLGTAYKTYLKEANLVNDQNGIYIYHKPVIDLKLEEEMQAQSLATYLKVLMGEA